MVAKGNVKSGLRVSFRDGNFGWRAAYLNGANRYAAAFKGLAINKQRQRKGRVISRVKAHIQPVDAGRGVRESFNGEFLLMS